MPVQTPAHKKGRQRVAGQQTLGKGLGGILRSADAE
jgi:hypothetical protein